MITRLPHEVVEEGPDDLGERLELHGNEDGVEAFLGLGGDVSQLANVYVISDADTEYLLTF